MIIRLALLTAGLMLFLAGLSWRFVLAGAAIALPVLYLLVISVPYRRARLFAFLEPERDPLGAGFQAMQSLIAVGSMSSMFSSRAAVRIASASGCLEKRSRLAAQRRTSSRANPAAGSMEVTCGSP